MKQSTNIRVIVAFLAILQVSWAVMPALQESALAQRRGGGSGRSARSGSSVNRSSSARSGSTNRSTSTRNRTSSPSSASRSSSARSPSRSTASRNSRGHRTATRNTARRSTRHRSRHRSRRVHRSRRYRHARWRHHSYWHHRHWYRRRWVGVVFITVVAFAAVSSSSTTYTYGSVTYVYYNPWYKKVLYDGEEGYILTTAPVGHEMEALPDGAETIEVDGATYYYADWSFWQAATGGGYVVVAPPVGAEVSSIPEEAIRDEEGDVVVYQFDELYFTQDTNDAGQTIYRVEPQPPDEEIEEIPTGSPSFVADGETYYYVNYNFYVQYEENGKTGYVNGEPEVGAQVATLPDEVTTVEEDGVTYYQFDSVFFEEVEDDDGQTFYEVVGSPDGSDEEVEG